MSVSVCVFISPEPHVQSSSIFCAVSYLRLSSLIVKLSLIVETSSLLLALVTVSEMQETETSS